METILGKAQECKNISQNLGMKVSNATPISAYHYIAVNLDTDGEHTPYKASKMNYYLL